MIGNQCRCVTLPSMMSDQSNLILNSEEPDLTSERAAIKVCKRKWYEIEKLLMFLCVDTCVCHELQCWMSETLRLLVNFQRNHRKHVKWSPQTVSRIIRTIQKNIYLKRDILWKYSTFSSQKVNVRTLALGHVLSFTQTMLAKKRGRF